MDENVHLRCPLASNNVVKFETFKWTLNLFLPNVSNDFLMQLISDLTMMTIDRPVFIESAAHGAAMMAGLSFGIWKSRSELQQMRQTERIFLPVENRWLDYAPLYSSWKNAVRRLCHWY